MLRTAIAGFVGVLVGAGVLLIAIRGAREPAAEVLRAERFELVDRRGNRLGVLWVDRGAPTLALYGHDGGGTATLAVHPSAGPSLNLFDRNGPPRATLCIEDAGARLELNDDNGQPRLSLVGRIPAVVVQDEKGNGRVSVGLVDGEGALDLRDKDGKVLWSAP